MARYFYVKGGGSASGASVDSADGIYSSLQTGSWFASASAYFDGFAGLMASTLSPGLVAGDVVIFSDESTVTATALVDLTLPESENLDFIVVDNDDMEVRIETTPTTLPAEITTSGDLRIRGNDNNPWYLSGLRFSAEDSICGYSSTNGLILENCRLEPGGQGSPLSTDIVEGHDYTTWLLTNVDIKPSDSSVGKCFGPNNVSDGSIIHWRGGNVIGGVNDAQTLLHCYAGRSWKTSVRDVDATALKTGPNLIDVQGVGPLGSEIVLANIELDTDAYTIGALGRDTTTVQVIACGSAAEATRRKHAMYTCQGDIVNDETRVMTGGSELVQGATTTAFSLEFDADTDATFHRPLRYCIARVYADFSNAAGVEIKVNVVHDSQGGGAGSDLQNDEAYIEAWVPQASSPINKLYTSRLSNFPFATPSDYANNTETWVTTGLTTPVKQSLTITTDGSEGSGWCEIFFCLAKDATAYVDCKPVLTDQ